MTRQRAYQKMALDVGEDENSVHLHLERFRKHSDDSGAEEADE
jgi:hypothetical protein